MKRSILIQFICLALVAATPAWANIYKKVGPDGRVSFTDTPTEEGYRIYIRETPDVLPWRTYAHVVAERLDLDPKLVRALIYVESGERPDAVSNKGAMGLMQLMPQTAKELGVSNPMRPRENVRGGVHYFSQMMERFGGDVKLALAAYNAGPSAVEKYGGIPPFKETQDFVRKVLNIYAKVKIGEDNS